MESRKTECEITVFRLSHSERGRYLSYWHGICSHCMAVADGWVVLPEVSTRHDATNREGINSVLLTSSPQTQRLFDPCPVGRQFHRMWFLIAWTPEVCRIIAFYRFWAIISPTFGGLGNYINRDADKGRTPPVRD